MVATYGQLIHEVRVTFVGGRWQARVVTLPNRIWVRPGGRTALKFEAGSAKEAEERAVAFILRDCVARGQRVLDPSLPSASPQGVDEPARRILVEYPLRFLPVGIIKDREPIRARSGVTLNLSETGLYICSEDPLPAHWRVRVDLRLPGLAERLEGAVIWTREKPEPGLRSGMGVHLLDPSLSYRARIQTLRNG